MELIKSIIDKIKQLFSGTEKKTTTDIVTENVPDVSLDEIIDRDKKRPVESVRYLD